MYLPFVATLALCRGDFTHFLLSFFLKGGKGNNMDQKKIGLFLKELRKEKELTQSQLAEQPTYLTEPYPAGKPERIYQICLYWLNLQIFMMLISVKSLTEKGKARI